LDFFILLDRTGPTHLGLGQTGPAMNSGDTLHYSEDNKEKGKSSATIMNRGMVEMLEVGHSPLFTLQNSGEHRRQ